MNKGLKNALRASFAAPEPANRDQFLRSLCYPKLTYSQFLRSQLNYIRKQLWAVSFLILLLGWAVAYQSPPLLSSRSGISALWIISALLPFLALLTATELYRSSSYRMAELETSCRFSLSQVVIARMSILGSTNLLVMILLMLLMNQASAYSLLQVITYLLVPYLITCGACLLVLNHVRGRDGIYGCAAAAGFVCILTIIISNTLQQLFSDAYLGFWLLLFALSGGLIVIQLRFLLKQMEARTWNLLLSD